MAHPYRPEIIKWIVVIVVTIAIGIFIFASKIVPEKYQLGLLIADYAIFFYANYKIIRISRKAREESTQLSENRAARRQAERLKDK